MAHAIHCGNIGFDCEGIIRAGSDNEVIRLAADHAQEVHRLVETKPGNAEKVKAAIRAE